MLFFFIIIILKIYLLTIKIFIDLTDPQIKGNDFIKSSFGNLKRANCIKSFNKIQVTTLSYQRSKILILIVFSNFNIFKINVVVGNKILNLNDLLSNIYIITFNKK